MTTKQRIQILEIAETSFHAKLDDLWNKQRDTFNYECENQRVTHFHNVAHRHTLRRDILEKWLKEFDEKRMLLAAVQADLKEAKAQLEKE